MGFLFLILIIFFDFFGVIESIGYLFWLNLLGMKFVLVVIDRLLIKRNFIWNVYCRSE